MRSNRLQLSASKTEVTTTRRLHQLPSLLLRVGDSLVAPAVDVRNLGMFIDADVSVNAVIRNDDGIIMFGHSATTRLYPRTVLQWLMSSLILSRSQLAEL